VYERLTGQLPVEYLHCNLSLLLSPSNSPTTRLYHAAKRLMDIVMALVGLAFLALLLPFVALANALSSPGPLFYRQAGECVKFAGPPLLPAGTRGAWGKAVSAGQAAIDGARC